MVKTLRNATTTWTVRPRTKYMRALYKYPQAEFPYDELLTVNRHRSRQELEYELPDTGVFEEEKYFDCQIEYTKNSADDILIRATITNQGAQAATLHVLPQWWYRNTLDLGLHPRRLHRQAEYRTWKRDIRRPSLDAWSLADGG